MRKVRDFESELKALSDRARSLKARRVQQLGSLVIACGADALDAETLAGALLLMTEDRDSARQEVCRVRGVSFFQEQGARTRSRTRTKQRGDAAVTPGAGSDGPDTSA